MSLDVSIAHSKQLKPTLSYLCYITMMGLLIAGAMKIVGVLLVSAFLILPSNSAQLIAKHRTQRNMIAMVICAMMSLI